MPEDLPDMHALRNLIDYASAEAREHKNVVLAKILDAALAETDRAITKSSPGRRPSGGTSRVGP
jgi:hypothetical protein